MLSRFTWRWEIADVMFHITQVVDLLAEAEKKGGFALAVDCLKSMGRNYKESNSHGTSIAQVTAPCPKYDFDICLQRPPKGQTQRSRREAEEAEPGNESPDTGTEKRQPPPAGSKAAR